MRDRNKPTGTSPCINSNHDCYDCKIVAVANLAMGAIGKLPMATVLQTRTRSSDGK